MVKNNTGLDDGINMDDESKTSVGHRKHIFFQTSINDQTPKLRVCMNGIFIEGLLDIGADALLLQNLV